MNQRKDVSYKEDDESYWLLAEWCDISGYDTDGINDELQQDPDDCALIDFDEEFPTWKLDTERVMEIFNIIKHCIENKNAFIDSVEIKRDDDAPVKIHKMFENQTLSRIIDDVLPFKYTPHQIVTAINHVFNTSYNENQNMNEKIPYNPADMNDILDYLLNNYQQ